jgi:hypothetical protein
LLSVGDPEPLEMAASGIATVRLVPPPGLLSIST